MTFGQHYLILTYLPTSIYIPFITRLAGTSLLATDTYHFLFYPIATHCTDLTGINDICTIAVAGKFKKWSKNLDSVLKRYEYDVRSSKKIWVQLEVPLRSYSQNMFIGILLSNLPLECHLQGNLLT